VLDASEKAKTFARPGNSVAALLWSDTGRLFVTFLDPEKGPTGHVATCQRLSPVRSLGHVEAPGDGTLLECTDHYADDQPNVD
jgi:hypothetical protein